MPKEESIARYKAVIVNALKAFQTCEVIQVNKSKNVDVDALSCLRTTPSLTEGKWIHIENQSTPSTTAKNILEITTKED